MRYFVYCRKSSEGDEKQALSLPAQVRELNELALKEGLTIVDTFQEAKSGRVPGKRPLFSEMLQRIRKKEATGIVCWHLNRLARNWQEGGEILQMLTDSTIEEIITSEKRITSQNTNDIVLGVEFGASSQFSKELSCNVQRGIREKIARGQYPGAAPQFYKNIGYSRFERNIAPDEINSPYFEEWVDNVILNNATLRQAAKWLNDKGLITAEGGRFEATTVHRIFQNPVYCGIIKYGRYPEKQGTWQPLISLEKFRRLQEVLGVRRKPRFYSHAKGYRGLLTCGECGCAITCTHKIKNGKSYIYYHCTKRRGNCHQHSITEDTLEDQIFEYVSQLQLNKSYHDDCIQYIRESQREESEMLKTSHVETSKKIEEIDTMINELMDMRLKKQLDQAQFDTKKQELLDRKREIREKELDSDFNQEHWLEQLEKFFETCFNIEEIFQQGTIDERSQLVGVLGKNLTLTDGRLGWNFKKPWDKMIVAENRNSRSTICRYRESNPGYKVENLMS